MDEAIATIIECLKEGVLNDPRGAEHRTPPLEDHVKTEVRRSIEGMRLDVPELPPEHASKVEAQAAALHAAGKAQRAYVKALRKAGLTALADHVAHTLWQEPPERADTLKYACAAEAFYLLEMFAKAPPTGTEGGPFRMIAATLYEAATGESEPDMKRACAFVLDSRRRFRYA
jgi:hypothetical protein